MCGRLDELNLSDELVGVRLAGCLGHVHSGRDADDVVLLRGCRNDTATHRILVDAAGLWDELAQCILLD